MSVINGDSSDTESETSPFQNQLKRCMVNGPRHEYLPARQLEAILSREAVDTELESTYPFIRDDPRLQDLVTFILRDAPKTFAVLMLTNTPELIVALYWTKYGDNQLPFDRDKLNNAVKDGLKNSPHRMELKTKGWTSKRQLGSLLPGILQLAVEIWQHRLIVPVFTPGLRFDYEVHADTTLPFRPGDTAAADSNKGGYGLVQKQLVHGDHLQVTDEDTLRDLQYEDVDGVRYFCVAQKQLIKADRWSFERFVEVAKNEAKNLEHMNRLGHAHFIRGIAYYTQAENHFLLFPWTEEGNLEQLWAKTDSTLSSTHCWAFKQLKGLASGIRMLHAENCRHGDLKPPNILCFRRNGETLDEMRLVIADVGLAKVHNEITQHRGHATKTTAISVTYMPPEFDLDARRDEPASRLYDIWSIGCVFLEFAIWLTHGLGGLQGFRTAVRGGGPSKPPVPFWNDNPTDNPSDNPSDDLRPFVKQTIEYLLDDHKPGSPLHRLVRLIKERLLVVNVPDRNTRTQRVLRQPADASEARSSASNTAPRVELTTATWNENVQPPKEPARADAEEFDNIMTDILRDVKVGSYRLELTTSTSTARSLATSMAHLSVEDARRNSLGGQTARNRKPMDDYMSTKFNSSWEYTPDEGLARQIFQTIDVHTVLPPHESTSLCTRCKGLDLLSPNCEFSDTVFSLESRSGVSNCTLCRLLLTWCNGRDEAAGMTFGFFRAEARIAARGDEKRGVATLCRADKGYPPRGIQLGFPRLPEAGSKAHMSVISHWLTQCDEVHNCYPRNMSFFPTRLIDVVGDSSPSVRLVCDTSHIDQGTKYIALSHMWGPNHQKTLKTLKANVQGRKEWVIPLDHLPKTFLDAIKVTRSLGHRFLWIDSLCIIQDDREDWRRESQRMEEVFSSAYCVIAATCASGTDDGFLKPRSERQAIPMTDAKSGISYYVCEAINDFSGHVDGSDINSRGWVLQERALARRTIHFTESQTYWECGSGVRCETLTRMNNDKASFLGDSNFPAYAVSQSKGKKIKLLQDLYEQYSNKKLSFAKDRPVAIKGLETRLIQTVGGQGGYGVFQNHLHRYLLWHRGKQPLEGIEEFSGGPVPTWSWMAWKGGIEFMRDIPGGTVDWNPKVGWLSPPTGANRDDPESLFLGAPVFDFTSSYINGLLLDNGEEHLPPGAKCVVLGVTQNQLVCYVLVVIRSTAPSAGSMGTWKRIGVGRVAQRHVVTEEPGSPVIIH